VLVVDDDALVLMNTAAMLEDLGHHVFEATSGGQALDILQREGEVDLVITDQAMPQMTGSELAQKIGRVWPQVPVVVATGYAELPPDTEHLRRLTKPFTQLELAREVALATDR
jgi:CheY-like chemotaxis protein